jgi:hypothetical protein
MGLPTTYDGMKDLLRNMAKESGDESAVEIVEKAIAETDASLIKRKEELEANPSTMHLVWGLMQQRGR